MKNSKLFFLTLTLKYSHADYKSRNFVRNSSYRVYRDKINWINLEITINKKIITNNNKRTKVYKHKLEHHRTDR